MHSRRIFIGKMASGIAGSFATGKVLGANDRIRVGIVGAGDRGSQILREAAGCPGTEIAALCDIYTKKLEIAAREFPSARAYSDYRRMLEDGSLDAVLIATPPHLHAQHFIAAVNASKHVYVEKAMAFTVADAKEMRAAYRRTTRNLTVQVGHQGCSSGQVADAAAFLKSGDVGKVTAINARMFRNTPAGKPQWSRPVTPDMSEQTIQWNAFLGPAPRRDFDANRYVNWRLFQDTSGGNVTENMCHQIAFWYKVMNLQIPRSAHMTGGVYLWKDGREVPDTMSVALEHRGEQPGDLLFSWNSGFGNSELGVSEDVLGTHGTVSRGQQIRYAPQKVNRKNGAEQVGQSATAPRAHMQNFLDAIRNGTEPNCPFDLGYRVSIACRMAVESYLQHRTVCWDPVREEIV